MGIYVKGMEMPKNCAGCFLRVGRCSKRIYMENRPSDCPLNEVPEPHGKLIDADELKKESQSKEPKCRWNTNADNRRDRRLMEHEL